MAENENDPDDCFVLFGVKPSDPVPESTSVATMATSLSNLTDCEIGNFTHNQIDSLRCAYENLPEVVVKVPQAGAPVFLVGLLLVYFLFSFVTYAGTKRGRNNGAEMQLKIDQSFTAIVAFKIDVENEQKENELKKLKRKMDLDTDVGIDFYIVGSKNSCASDLYRYFCFNQLY